MKEVVICSPIRQSISSILSHALNHTALSIKNEIWHVSGIPGGNSGNIISYCHPCNTGDDRGLGIARSPALPFHECRKARIKHLPKARVEIPSPGGRPSFIRAVFVDLIVSQAKHPSLIGGGGSG